MPHPRRLQISLSSFLLVAALVVVSTSHIITSYRYWRDEQTFERLRRLNGYLQIENPAHIQAVPVQAFEPQAWKWQLYLPPGRSYRLHVAASGIPHEGLPAKTIGHWDLSGDPDPQPLTVDVRVDNRDQCLATVLRPHQTGRWGIADENAGWIRQPEKHHIEVVRAAFTADTAHEPYELVRLCARRRSTAPGRTTPQEREDGLMVWIEPQ